MLPNTQPVNTTADGRHQECCAQQLSHVNDQPMSGCLWRSQPSLCSGEVRPNSDPDDVFNRSQTLPLEPLTC
jgi:hypothetical protein